jgi:hypothetical protein
MISRKGKKNRFNEGNTHSEQREKLSESFSKNLNDAVGGVS